MIQVLIDDEHYEEPKSIVNDNMDEALVIVCELLVHATWQKIPENLMEIIFLFLL